MPLALLRPDCANDAVPCSYRYGSHPRPVNGCSWENGGTKGWHPLPDGDVLRRQGGGFSEWWGNGEPYRGVRREEKKKAAANPVAAAVLSAGELGFEPRLTDPESVVLPLHYSPKSLHLRALGPQTSRPPPLADAGRTRSARLSTRNCNGPARQGQDERGRPSLAMAASPICRPIHGPRPDKTSTALSYQSLSGVAPLFRQKVINFVR